MRKRKIKGRVEGNEYVQVVKETDIEMVVDLSQNTLLNVEDKKWKC